MVAFPLSMLVFGVVVDLVSQPSSPSWWQRLLHYPHFLVLQWSGAARSCRIACIQKFHGKALLWDILWSGHLLLGYEGVSFFSIQLIPLWFSCGTPFPQAWEFANGVPSVHQSIHSFENWWSWRHWMVLPCFPHRVLSETATKKERHKGNTTHPQFLVAEYHFFLLQRLFRLYNCQKHLGVIQNIYVSEYNKYEKYHNHFIFETSS